jgi:hypothetical protein
VKKIFALVSALVLAFVLSSCEEEGSGQAQEQQATRKQQDHYAKTQPHHTYSASQARANLIAAQDAMALGADSWLVQYVEGVGITFECPSVGFPIPFGTNITNPLQVFRYTGGGRYTLPMMEPYGLYPPADVPATYANCVLPSGEIGIFYSEPLLTSFLFDVEYNKNTGRYEIPFDSEATVQVTREEAEVTGEAEVAEPTED